MTNVFTKYACVKPWKYKKGKTVLHVLIKIVNESNSKPNKLWVDQEKGFYNELIQEWSDNNILMYLRHNEGKQVTAERFIRRLKGKIYKIMTANDSKSCFSYLNKLIVQQNNNYPHSIGKNPINADYSALTETN